jgi:L-methionine (R)-S-oxide reductase
VSKHEQALTTIRAAVERESDPTRVMEIAVATLQQHLPAYSWVGVYLLDGNELVLGPFVGKPSPHTRIPLGRGICGAAAVEKQTIVVDDVSKDTRYLACSPDTRSEIVVPILHGGDVLGEIDVDSDRAAAFDGRDRMLLESVAGLLANRLAATRS